MKVLATLGLLALSACASELNEGQVRMGIPQHTSGNITPEVFRATHGSVLETDEVFMITLVSTYICNFRETQTLEFLSPTNVGAIACGDKRSSGINTRGEIAILAGFAFQDQKGTGGAPEERLVFLSHDVRETGQLLNFINLPIYGPAPYQKATSRLRMTILELDKEESEEQSDILQSVADAGASFASPVQGKVIEVLASIGETLIKTNKDDREMRFDAGFDVPYSEESKSEDNIGTVKQSPATELSIMRNPLREGYIILMRRERRDRKDHFKNIKVCPKLGLVVEADKECDGNSYYADSTWILLRVTKEDEDVANAILNQTLRDALEARQSGGITAKNLRAVQSAIDTLSKSLGK